jgi:1-deoxyxylulose-5-phosphate synthase
MGTAHFGHIVAEDDGVALIRRAIELGVSTFDTSNVYSTAPGSPLLGRTEEVLAKAITGMRDRVVIITKVFHRRGADRYEVTTPRSALDDDERWMSGISPNDRGLTRANIVRCVEGSLRCLGTDYIDIYQLHSWDNATPIAETLAVLDDLVHAGKVRYISCSHVAAWKLYKALCASERLRLARFESIAAPYSVIERDVETDLIAASLDASVSVLAYRVLAGGLLAGSFDPAAGSSTAGRAEARATTDSEYLAGSGLDVLRGFYSLADRIKRPPVELAVGWVLSQPAVAAAVVGADSIEQLEELVRAEDRSLSDDELLEIAAYQVAPGSVTPAPR